MQLSWEHCVAWVEQRHDPSSPFHRWESRGLRTHRPRPAKGGHQEPRPVSTRATRRRRICPFRAAVGIRRTSLYVSRACQNTNTVSTREGSLNDKFILGIACSHPTPHHGMPWAVGTPGLRCACETKPHLMGNKLYRTYLLVAINSPPFSDHDAWPVSSSSCIHISRVY